MSEPTVYAYAGFVDGVLVSVVVDRPEHPIEVRECVAILMADGMTIHRVTLDFARRYFGEKCEPDPAKAVAA